MLKHITTSRLTRGGDGNKRNEHTMYQSPYFIEECKKRMISVSNWGFILTEEISDEEWALLRWKLEDISIAIEYHPYAYTLTTYVDYRKNPVDVGKLYDLVGIKEKYVYQYGGAGLEKGIEAITGSVLAFLNCFDLFDHTDLKAAVKKAYEQRETVESYILEKADQAYLSGLFDEAKRYYLQYEYALNEIQKSRLKRILNGNSSTNKGSC